MILFGVSPSLYSIVTFDEKSGLTVPEICAWAVKSRCPTTVSPHWIDGPLGVWNSEHTAPDPLY